MKFTPKLIAEAMDDDDAGLTSIRPEVDPRKFDVTQQQNLSEVIEQYKQHLMELEKMGNLSARMEYLWRQADSYDDVGDETSAYKVLEQLKKILYLKR